MKRTRAVRGETLVETLVAILMLTLIMLSLSSSLISAAKVNANIKNSVKSCNMSKEHEFLATVTVSWGSGDDAQSNGVNVTEYGDNGYYFYEKNP